VESEEIGNPFSRKVTEEGKVFCSNCGKSIFISLVEPLKYDFMGLVCTNCRNHEDVSFVRILEVQKKDE